MMSKQIDLNADIGELPGDEGRALDAAILSSVTSCNIACGGHAGDEDSMRETLKLAKKAGVRAGAHPSYPDREGFGRRTIEISEEALQQSLAAQVAALRSEAVSLGVSLTHLKPHGALYNEAAQDSGLALMIASVTSNAGIATLVGPPLSKLELAAGAFGLDYFGEGFADRSYEEDGSLTPRSEPGSVYDEEESQIKQALQIAAGSVSTRTGKRILLPVQTICVHGDTPGAQKSASRIRDALIAEGFTLGAAA